MEERRVKGNLGLICSSSQRTRPPFQYHWECHHHVQSKHSPGWHFACSLRRPRGSTLDSELVVSLDVLNICHTLSPVTGQVRDTFLAVTFPVTAPIIFGQPNVVGALFSRKCRLRLRRQSIMQPANGFDRSRGYESRFHLARGIQSARPVWQRTSFLGLFDEQFQLEVAMRITI